MVWWKAVLLRVTTAAGGHGTSPGEAIDLIRDLHIQKVEAMQIAANLNLLKIRAAKGGMWTEDGVKEVLTLLPVARR